MTLSLCKQTKCSVVRPATTRCSFIKNDTMWRARSEGMAEDNNFRGYWYNSSAQKDRQVVLSGATTLLECKTPSKVGCQVE